MTHLDVAGLAGVVLILIAYAGAALGRIDAQRAPALFLNLVGASLILASLLGDKFNLSATVMEGAWALVAIVGLIRIGWRKLRR